TARKHHGLVRPKTSLSSFGRQIIYAGNFNCHRSKWGCSTRSEYGDARIEWTSVNEFSLMYEQKDPTLEFGQSP
ncbi:MAG: hypothetical protein M3H12_02565, partial [Chromatiales bacterium]